MALPPHLLRELEDIVQELDLFVYRLERPPREEVAAERARLRRELERLGRQLDDAVRALR
jgi:hypothetical protein